MEQDSGEAITVRITGSITRRGLRLAEEPIPECGEPAEDHADP